MNDYKTRFATNYAALRATSAPSGAPFIGPGDMRYDSFMGIYSPSQIGTDPLHRIAIYKRAIWVYACTEARAVPISMVPLKLYRRTPDSHNNEVIDHPILDTLVDVNPNWDTASTIRKDTENSLCIHGRYQWLKVRNPSNIVKELYGLPVQYTKIIPGTERGQKIKAFRYQPNGSVREDYKPQDIVYFRYNTPEQDADGLSPLQVAIETTTADISIQVAQNAMANNAARPSAIVTVKPKWSEADYKRVSEEINRKYAGAVNSGKIMLIDNADNVAFNKVQLTPREMEWIKEHQANAQDICVAFRVPPMIANDFSDASRLANAGAGHRFYWENTLIPELTLWESILNWQLLWTEDWGRGGKRNSNGTWYSYEYYNGYYLQHDLTGIQALREEENSRTERARDAFGYGATVDEIRAMRGQDPLDDPVMGSTIFVPNNVIPMDVVLQMADRYPDAVTDSGGNITQATAQANSNIATTVQRPSVKAKSNSGSESNKTNLGPNDKENPKRQKLLQQGIGQQREVRAELRRWSEVWKRSPRKALTFKSDILPQELQDEIRGRLPEEGLGAFKKKLNTEPSTNNRWPTL